MITPTELKARMISKPFVPFRVCMSDGKTYDITNHDMMFVTRNAVYIGVTLDADDIVDQLIQCAILHITCVEELTPGKAA